MSSVGQKEELLKLAGKPFEVILANGQKIELIPKEYGDTYGQEVLVEVPEKDQFWNILDFWLKFNNIHVMSLNIIEEYKRFIATGGRNKNTFRGVCQIYFEQTKEDIELAQEHNKLDKWGKYYIRVAKDQYEGLIKAETN